MALSEEQLKRLSSDLYDPREAEKKRRRRIEATAKARMQADIGKAQAGFAGDIEAITSSFKKIFKRGTYEKIGEKANEFFYPKRGYSDEELDKYDVDFNELQSSYTNAFEKLKNGEPKEKVLSDLKEELKIEDSPFSSQLKAKTKWLGEIGVSLAELAGLGTEYVANKFDKNFSKEWEEVAKSKVGSKLAEIGGKLVNITKPGSAEEAAVMKQFDEYTMVFGEVKGLKDASKVSRSVNRLKRVGVADKDVAKIINNGLKIEEEDLAKIARNYSPEVALGIEKTNDPKLAKRFVDLDVDVAEIEKHTLDIPRLSDKDRTTINEFSTYILEGEYKKNPDIILEEMASSLAEKLEIDIPKQKRPVLANRLLEAAERDENMQGLDQLYRNIGVDPKDVQVIEKAEEVVDPLMSEARKYKSEEDVYDKLGFTEGAKKTIIPIKDNGNVVGGIDASIKKDYPDTLLIHHVRILPESQGKGIGTKAIKQLFEDNPKINKLQGHATAESKSFWKKQGSTFSGSENNIFTIEKSKFTDIWNKAKGNEPTGEFAKPYLKHTPAVFAGYEKDEDGNIHYNAKKAIVAIGGVSLVGHPKMQKKITSVAKTVRGKLDPKEAKTILKEAEKEFKPKVSNLDPKEPTPDKAPIFRRFKQQVEDKWISAREKIQDDWVRQEKLQKEDGVDLAFNPLQKKVLYAGRKGTRQELLFEEVSEIDKEVVSMSKQLKVKDKDLYREVNDYLISKHAPERNAELGEKAAGITTEQANARRLEIEEGENFNAVKALAARIEDLHKQNLDLMLEGQLIDRELYDTLRNKYKNHIPLNRILETDDDVFQALATRGLDVKSSGLKRAKGSELEVEDILKNVTANLTQTITRVEKNRINLETLNFARKNPELELFEEIKPRAIGKTFDDKAILEEIKDPLVLSIREKGKPVYLKIKDEQIATMLKGVGQEQTPGWLKFIGAITRFYSATATRFNVAFAPSNLIRDSQELAVYLSSVKGIGFTGAAKSGINIPGSMKDVLNFMRGKETEGAKLYEEMRLAGGTTGGFSASTKKQLDLDFEKIKKLNRSNPRKAFEYVIRGIDNYNTVAEDATRLAAYKVAKANGFSVDDAAQLAKEATIDFNKKGTWGPAINALYMFSNASIQGSAKMLKAFKNPKVLATVSSGVGLAVWTINRHNDSVDPEWREKVSQWDRNSNLPIVVPTDDGVKYITIPVSWGLKPIKVMADTAYDTFNGYSKGIIDSTSNILASTIEAYNPLGGSDLTSTLTPTVLDMPLEIKANEAWHGGIIRPDWMEELPDAEKKFASTEETMIGGAFVAATGWISEKTDRQIDVSPENALYVFNQLIGGAGRLVGQTFNTIASIGTEKEVTANDIPFVSRFYKEKDEERVQQISNKLRSEKMFKELKKFKTGSEEQKQYIRDYFLSLDSDEEIAKEAFKIQDGGYDTSGIFRSKEKLAIEPTFKKALLHAEAGRTDLADEIYQRLSEPEREAFKKVRTSWRSANSSKLRELLEEDPIKAVEFAKSIELKSERDRLWKNLSKEEKELINSALSLSE